MPESLPTLQAGSANAPRTRGVCAVARADLHRTLPEVSRATASHRDLESLLRDLTDVLQRVAPFDVLRLASGRPSSRGWESSGSGAPTSETARVSAQ